MPNGMHSMPVSEEGSASMQSPQPEDRAWQTGQWVNAATDPVSFPMNVSEVLVESVVQHPIKWLCRIQYRAGGPGLAVPVCAAPAQAKNRSGW